MIDGRVEFDPAPSVASRNIVPASWYRTALVFFAPAVGRVTLSTDPVTGDGRGFVLAAGQGSLQFTDEKHGDMVHRAWHALYSAGASGVGWIQSLG